MKEALVEKEISTGQREMRAKVLCSPEGGDGLRGMTSPGSREALQGQPNLLKRERLILVLVTVIDHLIFGYRNHKCFPDRNPGRQGQPHPGKANRCFCFASGGPGQCSLHMKRSQQETRPTAMSLSNNTEPWTLRPRSLVSLWSQCHLLNAEGHLEKDECVQWRAWHTPTQGHANSRGHGVSQPIPVWSRDLGQLVALSCNPVTTMRSRWSDEVSQDKQPFP